MMIIVSLMLLNEGMLQETKNYYIANMQHRIQNL